MMLRHLVLGLWTLVAFAHGLSAAPATRPGPVAVVCGKRAAPAEALAAREVRRYVYARTGQLLPMVAESSAAPDGALVIVGAKDQPWVQAALGDGRLRQETDGLAAEQYRLKTFQHGDRWLVLVAGGDPIGTLYGAYRLAERLGVRFYLHGDVIPDRRIALRLPDVDELGRPLFDRRGIQPFHDFPEGPDWWRNADAYKAVLGQLPKLRMNFFGLHCYPEGHVGPEPAVWIGRPGDVNDGGRVEASYPSRHFATSNATGSWGYAPTKTGDYRFGAAALFDRDDYGPDYMPAGVAWTGMNAEQSNAVFDRFGALLRDAFSFARGLGIKTCIGTETPLAVPAAVRRRLEADGKNPADPKVVQELYAGMFQRIAATHPLDYYWFWTPEPWTWRPVQQAQIDATLADFRAALAAHAQVKPPFTLATCGWVLGPPQQPSLFDRFLPKHMPMSCINRNVGHDPVEPGFARVQGRPLWAIPWLEDDPAMIVPQLWVGRMRKDAADAHKFGCTGLLGIHWRTRAVGPNVAALAAAAWDQRGWNPELGKRVGPEELPAREQPLGTEADRAKYRPERYLSSDDFYDDWARSQFGPEAARQIAALFVRLDGRLPRPATWVRGPGGIRPDARPWGEVAKQFEFVDELAACAPHVQGAGNRERFDFWVHQFRYLRATAQLNCTWARLNQALARIKKEREAQKRQTLARDVALPIRIELIEQLRSVHRELLASVTTTGLMGNVANWQQHVMPLLLDSSTKELTDLLGQPLPASAVPSQDDVCPPHLFVPVVRTAIEAGEPLRLEAIVIGARPRRAAVYWRPLGAPTFRRADLPHVARGVYRTTLDGAVLTADFEYYIEMETDAGPLRFPATAPELNQTVVACRR